MASRAGWAVLGPPSGGALLPGGPPASAAQTGVEGRSLPGGERAQQGSLPPPLWLLGTERPGSQEECGGHTTR